MKLFLSLLGGDAGGEAPREEVDLKPDRRVSLILQTAAGEYYLTETAEGRLNLHTPGGRFVLLPENTNSLDVEVQTFGRAGRKRFDWDSVAPK